MNRRLSTRDSIRILNESPSEKEGKSGVVSGFYGGFGIPQ